MWDESETHQPRNLEEWHNSNDMQSTSSFLTFQRSFLFAGWMSSIAQHCRRQKVTKPSSMVASTAVISCWYSWIWLTGPHQQVNCVGPVIWSMLLTWLFQEKLFPFARPLARAEVSLYMGSMKAATRESSDIEEPQWSGYLEQQLQHQIPFHSV